MCKYSNFFLTRGVIERSVLPEVKISTLIISNFVLTYVIKV